MKVIVSSTGRWSTNRLIFDKDFWCTDKGLVRIVEKRADYKILLHYLASKLLMNEDEVENRCEIDEELYKGLMVKEVGDGLLFKVIDDDCSEQLEVLQESLWIRATENV